MKVLAAVLLAVVSASGVACGGDGGSRAEKSPRPERDIQPEAQERAKSMLLVLSDFPEGWQASPGQKRDEAEESKMNACVGADYSGTTLIGDVVSEDFIHEDTTEASSVTEIYGSPAQAMKVMDEDERTIEDSEAERCLREFYERMLPEEGLQDVALDRVEVSELDVLAPEGVDETKAWRILLRVRLKAGEGEEPFTGYADLVRLREGDAITQLDATDVFTPFDSDLRNKLLQTLADRMTSGTAGK